MVKKVISGCQTGADFAGLLAAEKLGLETGGWMPAGCRTATGPRPDLAARFGLACTKASNYHVRTHKNVVAADATIIFGRATSAGSKLTIKYCKSHQPPKPHLEVPWGTSIDEAVAMVQKFVYEQNPTTLNIAGNREEKCPGIEQWVLEILTKALVVGVENE